MKKTVVAFGEILWDILPSGLVLGGAPFNFVYRVNSLGDAGLMASRLGRDDLGRQAFDMIVCAEVLEHVDDLNAFLKETLSMLKPGGLFFFGTRSRR
jgi:SAM-dependent methyltransferase